MAQIPALRPRKIIPDASIQIQWLQDDGERASSHSHANKRKPVEAKEIANLEIPLWTVQKEINEENCFQLPKNYIEYQDEYNIIEYELDEKDELFLNRIQKKNTDIDEDLLESAIDYFEKESFLAKEYSLFVPAKDENDLSICCVCCKLELQDQSLLMTCEGCGIISHPCCQGLEEEPENWFCERCVHEQIRSPNQTKPRFKERFMRLRREKKCAYCQKADGSLIRRNNEWAHTVCVAWLPGFSFNPDESNIKPCQLKTKCAVCKGTESLIHCSESPCKNHYHGSCAQESNYYFEITPEGKPLSYCSSHSLKKKSKNFQTLLPLGQGRVDIGQFLSETTKLELEKLINKNISEETFKTLWDYWKNKRLESDYGRAPIIPRLKIEKDLLQALSMKDVETKLNEAKKRWESLKTKLLPENKPIVNSNPLSVIARSPINREKNNFKVPNSTRLPPDHQQPSNNKNKNNNNKTRNQLPQSPTKLNNDYSEEIDDVETNVEESDYEQYVDDEESKSDEVEILQDNTRTPKNNELSKRISKPSKYLNEKDYTCIRDLRKSLESSRSTKKKSNNNNNKIATPINIKNNNHHKSKASKIIEQEDEEQEDEEQEDEEQEDEEQEGEEQEDEEQVEKETRPGRAGKKRTFESATLFPTPGSILYKKVKKDDRNNKINTNYNTNYANNTNYVNSSKNNKKIHHYNYNNNTNNNNTNNNNNNNNNNTNTNNNNNRNNINNGETNGKKLLFKLDQASQIDVMKVDKKAIMQEQATKTRPPTRRSPGKIASGIPTYYGSGADRIAWTPNVQFSQNGDKKDSAFLFGAGFPSPLSPSERPAKRTW